MADLTSAVGNSTEAAAIEQQTPKGTMKPICFAVAALSIGLSAVVLHAGKGPDRMDDRIFELRTYHAVPGRMEALQARFRDHTIRLFEKHHMTVIGFWNPADAQEAERTLIYVLAFPSQEAAARSWKEFQADPEWKAVKEASEQDGKLVESIDSVFLKPADYSPIK